MRRSKILECEVCHVQGVPLQRAHWVASAKGGEMGCHNIIKLCPNCHYKLDSGDMAIEHKVRTKLFLREAARILQNNLHSESEMRHLLNISEAIVLRKPLRK